MKLAKICSVFLLIFLPVGGVLYIFQLILAPAGESLNSYSSNYYFHISTFLNVLPLFTTQKKISGSSGGIKGMTAASIGTIKEPQKTLSQNANDYAEQYEITLYEETPIIPYVPITPYERYKMGLKKSLGVIIAVLLCLGLAMFICGLALDLIAVGMTGMLIFVSGVLTSVLYYPIYALKIKAYKKFARESCLGLVKKNRIFR